MADGTAALIRHLDSDNADIASTGGGIALQSAIRHADVVRKLVLATAFAWSTLSSSSTRQRPRPRDCQVIRAVTSCVTDRRDVHRPDRR
jgi:pimeloyl-ACP methyl ester carboxylesterase